MNRAKMAREWVSLVKQLPCVLCRLLRLQQEGATDAHHIREGQGMSQRAGDYCVIALCHEGCHQGRFGVHGDRTLLRIAKVSEMDLLDLTIEAVYEQMLLERRL